MRVCQWLIIACLASAGCESGEAPVPETEPAAVSAAQANEAADDSEPTEGQAEEQDQLSEYLDFIELTTAGASPDDELPMLVVVHGYGDSPEGISGLFRGLEAPVRLIMPRGPFPHARGGHSWYDIGSADYAGQVTESADGVAELARHLSGIRPTTVRMVSGFSQGGILSYELAARHDGLFAAAFPIAGKLPNAEGLIAGPEGPVTRVHAFHGEADDRIPFADGESAVAALQGAGWAVEMTSVAGVGHSINAEMREALYAAVISALPL